MCLHILACTVFPLITLLSAHLAVYVLSYFLVMKKTNYPPKLADAYLWATVLHIKGIGAMTLSPNAFALLNMSPSLNMFHTTNPSLLHKISPFCSHQKLYLLQPIRLQIRLPINIMLLFLQIVLLFLILFLHIVLLFLIQLLFLILRLHPSHLLRMFR